MVIVLGLLFLYLAIKGLSNPFIGMIGLLCVTMINPGELYPIFAALRMEKIFVLIVFVSWAMHEKIVIPPISKKLLAFYGVMVVGVPFAFYKGGALESVTDFFTTVLYHLMMINLVNNRERFRTMITTYVALYGWIASGAIWGYLHGEVNAGGALHGLARAQGLTSSAGDPNSLGVRLVTAMPLMVLLIGNGSKKQKWIGAGALLLSLASVMLTGSRGSFATLLLLGAAFMFTRKTGLLYIPVAVVLFAALWTIVPANIKERYTTLTDVLKNEQLDESAMARKYSRIAGWHMFLDHPLLGVGAGNFKFANGSQYWPGPGRKHWLQAHNLYIQLLADLGLVGAVVWLIFFFSLLRITLELRRWFKAREDIDGIFKFYPTACLFSLSVILVNGYSTHSLYSGAWYFLAALSGALYYQIFAEKFVRSQAPTLLITPEPAEALPANG